MSPIRGKCETIQRSIPQARQKQTISKLLNVANPDKQNLEQREGTQFRDFTPQELQLIIQRRQIKLYF